MSESKRRDTRNIGSYILGVTLGEGAFGTVKVATHIHTGEKVAIKILDKNKMEEDSDDMDRVQTEIAILKKMRHKNIIQLYEIMESSKNIYLVMEYCEGKELFEYIVMKKKLSEQEALKYFQEIIDSVDYLHSQNIVHRDLKPENLLLDYKMSIKVSDFGLSRSYTNDNLLSTPCGTPSYAPPEMLKGEDYHGLLSDIWSAGVILYAMLCGYLPFSESNEEINCQNIIQGDFDLPDWLSDSVTDLLLNILKTDPLERYDLEQIKSHPWFTSNSVYQRPGLIIGYHKIPIDESILQLVENYGYNKEKARVSIQNNKFDVMTAIYYLSLRKFIKDGGTSISDLLSIKYVNYINDENNLFNSEIREETKYTVEDACAVVQILNDNKITEINIIPIENFDDNNDKLIQEEQIIKANEDIISENNENEQENLKANKSNSTLKSNSYSCSKNNSTLKSNSKLDDDQNKIDEMEMKFLENQIKASSTRKSDRLSIRMAHKVSVYIHNLDLEINQHKDLNNSKGIINTVNSNSKKKENKILEHFRRNSIAITNFDSNETVTILKHRKRMSVVENNDNFRNNLIEMMQNKINLNQINDNNRNKTNLGINNNEIKIMKINNEKPLNNRRASLGNKKVIYKKLSIKEKSVITGRAKSKTVSIKPKSANYENSNLKKESINNNINSSLITNNNVTDTEINMIINNKNCNNTQSDLINKKNENKSETQRIKSSTRSRNYSQINKPKNYQIENISLPQEKVKIVKNVSKSRTRINKSKTKQPRNYNRKNKFIKQQIVHTNINSSFENSKSKTPIRNLSYSPDTAVKPVAKRVDVLPWNIKKKILETNQENGKQKIISEYEEFKKEKKVKNLKPTQKITIKKLIKPTTFFNKQSSSGIKTQISKDIYNTTTNTFKSSYNKGNSINFSNSSKKQNKESITKSFSKQNFKYNNIENAIKINTNSPFTAFKPMNKKIFVLDDPKLDNLKTHYGPVDFSCILYYEIPKILEKTNEILTKKKIIFVKTNPYKFRCSKNGSSFDIELFNLDQELEGYYIKFKNVQGDNCNFRKLTQNILMELNKY